MTAMCLTSDAVRAVTTVLVFWCFYGCLTTVLVSSHVSSSPTPASSASGSMTMDWQRNPARAMFVVAPGESVFTMTPSQLAEQRNYILNQLESLAINANLASLLGQSKNGDLIQTAGSDSSLDTIASDSRVNYPFASSAPASSASSSDGSKSINHAISAYDSAEAIKVHPNPRKRTIIRGNWGPGNKHIPIDDLFNCLQSVNIAKKDLNNCYQIIKRTR